MYSFQYKYAIFTHVVGHTLHEIVVRSAVDSAVVTDIIEVSDFKRHIVVIARHTRGNGSRAQKRRSGR